MVIDAEGFIVNQEDVNAVADAMGKFDDTFDCKFYEDENRQNQILSNNIVNMGEMIYGQVESVELAGLSQGSAILRLRKFVIAITLKISRISTEDKVPKDSSDSQL